jgi:hypothetical protein
MSDLRVSQIIVQLVLLDEFDAPRHAEPIVFAGDADGTAEVKLAAWLGDLPAKLDEAQASIAAH